LFEGGREVRQGILSFLLTVISRMLLRRDRQSGMMARTHIVPDLWDTVVRVCDLNVLVLVVHSDADSLFPVSMAERVAKGCGSQGNLVVVNGLSHNAPIFAPTGVYWQPIVEWVKQRSAETERKRSLVGVNRR
jgi:pimeloyl-ACP methyl ester carboxylesterase